MNIEDYQDYVQKLNYFKICRFYNDYWGISMSIIHRIGYNISYLWNLGIEGKFFLLSWFVYLVLTLTTWLSTIISQY